MSGRRDKNLPPEWLAAYADGEMDHNAALAPYKKPLEEWLAEHPEAVADVEEQRRLRELVQQTAPLDPDAGAWGRMLARLHEAPGEIARRRAWSWGRLASVLAMTAAALWLVSVLVTPQPAPPQKLSGGDEEELAVATADEIEILSIEGDATRTLVIGEAPVHGALELLQAGEMKVTSVEPDVPRNMRLDVREGPATPMIWALLDSER
jgi:hypothetical protein